MTEFMDEIVESVGWFAKGFLQVLVLITAPAWILPYMLIRSITEDNNGGKCEVHDCDACPFPPCKDEPERGEDDAGQHG